MERRRVTVKETLLVIGCVTAVDVAILTTWTIVDPLHYTREILTEDRFGYPLSSVGYCTSDHWQIFASSIGALHLALLLVACYYCYISRGIPTRFSSGRSLSMAMFSNFQIFLLGVPVLIIVGSDTKSSFVVRSMIIWVNDFVVVSLIFGSLMYSWWGDHRDGVDGRAALGNSLRAYATKRSNSQSNSNSNSNSVRASDASGGGPPQMNRDRSWKDALKDALRDERIPKIEEDHPGTDAHHGEVTDHV